MLPTPPPRCRPGQSRPDRWDALPHGCARRSLGGSPTHQTPKALAAPSWCPCAWSPAPECPQWWARQANSARMPDKSAMWQDARRQPPWRFPQCRTVPLARVAPNKSFPQGRGHSQGCLQDVHQGVEALIYIIGPWLWIMTIPKIIMVYTHTQIGDHWGWSYHHGVWEYQNCPIQTSKMMVRWHFFHIWGWMCQT